MLDPGEVARKSVSVSSDQATDGTSSLALSASYSGSTWQAASAEIVLPQPVDWSAHTTVTLDIYAPAGSTDFGAQIFTRTGDAQTETDSEHVALIAGQWNKVTVQLSLLGDLHDVRAFGVKIGTNITVFAGMFTIDKIVFGDAPQVTFVFPPIDANTLTVTALKPGSYTVEVWDTQAGTILSSTPVASSDGTVSIDVPSFSSDLAIKVKPQ